MAKKRLKESLCPHGNHGDEKFEDRKDSGTTQLYFNRILCTIFVLFAFCFGCLEIKDYYLQNVPIKREIYFRPHSEWKVQKGVLWSLKKLPYIMIDDELQWEKLFEEWFLDGVGFEHVWVLPQIFLKLRASGTTKAIVTKSPMTFRSVD